MLLTTTDIAKMVGKTRWRILQLIQKNMINAQKIGRDWMIDESQIEVIKNLPDNRGKFRWQNKRRNESNRAA
jgi:hypothetical protein